MNGPSTELQGAVSAARDVLSSLSGVLAVRDAGPVPSGTPAHCRLGRWSPAQDALLDAMVAMDTIRVNAAVVPSSLREFVA